MDVGWTEWNYVDGEGRPISIQDAMQRWGKGWEEHVRIKGERLTKLGRKLVEANRE
jgi:hypothetical protein